MQAHNSWYIFLHCHAAQGRAQSKIPKLAMPAPVHLLLYWVSRTTLSTALAKYSTLRVLRPAMLMRPFLVM